MDLKTVMTGTPSGYRLKDHGWKIILSIVPLSLSSAFDTQSLRLGIAEEVTWRSVYMADNNNSIQVGFQELLPDCEEQFLVALSLTSINLIACLSFIQKLRTGYLFL